MDKLLFQCIIQFDLDGNTGEMTLLCWASDPELATREVKRYLLNHYQNIIILSVLTLNTLEAK
jgi:hypothetical protein